MSDFLFPFFQRREGYSIVWIDHSSWAERRIMMESRSSDARPSIQEANEKIFNKLTYRRQAHVIDFDDPNGCMKVLQHYRDSFAEVREYLYLLNPDLRDLLVDLFDKVTDLLRIMRENNEEDTFAATGFAYMIGQAVKLGKLAHENDQWWQSANETIREQRAAIEER